MNSGLVQAQHITNQELEEVFYNLNICTISLQKRSNLKSQFTSFELRFDLFRCFIMSLQPNPTPVFTSAVVEPTTDVAPSFTTGSTEASGVAPVFTSMSDIFMPDMTHVTKQCANRLLKPCGLLSRGHLSFQIKCQCWCHRGWRRRRSGCRCHSCSAAVLDSTKISKTASREYRDAAGTSRV